MKIAIDIDGVIFDYIDQTRAYADFYDYNVLCKNGVKNKQALKLKDRYDWTKEELNQFVDENFVKLTYTTNFKPLAVEIINLLKKEGNSIYIVTYRGKLHPEVIEIIKDRFSIQGLNIDKYFWKIEDKVSIYKKENIDVVIDDSPEICKQAVENDILTLYFREKDMEKISNPLLIEVDNWGQIYREIKEIERRN